MNRAKHIANSVVLCLFVLLITTLFVFGSDKEISQSERRKLQQFPELTFSSLSSGKFMDEFELYVCDQIPFREQLRKLKAKMQFDVFRQKDNGGIYVKDGYASKLDKKLNEASLEHFSSRIKNVYDMYIEGNNCNSFYAVIPDKNFYLAGDDYPTFDYSALFDRVDKELSYMQKIDIKDTLSLESFYYTDSHWRQEKILPTAEKIAEALKIGPLPDFEQEVIGDFYGVYCGQSALNLSAEELSVMKNSFTENAIVTNFEKNTVGKVYSTELFSGMDSYDIFLSGAVSLLKIENPSAKNEKELVIFRDSFSSSLAPLLLSGYKTVTLVDLRYILPELIGDYVSFENCDVLFIYSTMMINSSLTLK